MRAAGFKTACSHPDVQHGPTAGCQSGRLRARSESAGRRRRRGHAPRRPPAVRPSCCPRPRRRCGWHFGRLSRDGSREARGIGTSQRTATASASRRGSGRTAQPTDRRRSNSWRVELARALHTTTRCELPRDRREPGTSADTAGRADMLVPGADACPREPLGAVLLRGKGGGDSWGRTLFAFDALLLGATHDATLGIP